MSTKNPTARTHLVYFIQAVDGGPIKIGRATDPVARLGLLQNASPTKLRILAVVRSSPTVGERTIHREFVHLRLHGEWFSPAPELLAFIEMNRESLVAVSEEREPARDFNRAATDLAVVPTVKAPWRKNPPRAMDSDRALKTRNVMWMQANRIGMYDPLENCVRRFRVAELAKLWGVSTSTVAHGIGHAKKENRARALKGFHPASA